MTNDEWRMIPQARERMTNDRETFSLREICMAWHNARMRPLKASLVVFALLSLLASAADWPAWRGPTADGVTPETNLPLNWSATENVKWKVALPERGNSTPIVSGDRVFVTQAAGERRTVMC